MNNQPISNLPPIFSKDFIFITAINLFVFFSFQMIFPTLPLYVKSLGGTDAVIGLVAGTFTITSLMTRPFAGLALDKLGRKPVLVFGLAFLFLAAACYSFAQSIFVIVLIRLLHGLGWGTAGTSTATVVAEIIPHSRLGTGMGYFSMSNSLSMAIAPAAGLYLAHHYGFHIMFGVSAILALIALILAFSINYRPFVAKPEDTQSLYEKTAWGPALMIFFVTMTFGGLMSFLPLFALSQGIHDIGAFFTVYALAVLISRPMTGRIVDTYGYDITIVPGFVLIAVAIFTVSQAHNLDDFLFAGFLYGIGFGTCQMTFQTMVVKNVTVGRLGAANATYFSGIDAGMGLGAIILGTIAEFYGYRHMYETAASFMVVSLLIYLFFLRPNYIKKIPIN